MGNNPSIPTPHDRRTRRLEVIDAGFARTATVSFALAFGELLGGDGDDGGGGGPRPAPVMHGGTQLLHREDAYVARLARLYEIRRRQFREEDDGGGVANEDDKKKKGKKSQSQIHAARSSSNNEQELLLLETLREVMAGFAAAADVPLVHFLPELLEMYPEAKVVLVTRDAERWWRSFGVFADHSGEAVLWVLRVLWWPLPGARWFADIARGFDEEYVLGVEKPNKGLLEAHNEWVRRQVPADRLLELDLADAGWEPLCRFLGKPVPADKPFPRANDAEARDAAIRGLLVRTAVAWGCVLVSAVGAGAVGMRLWRARW